MRLSPVRFLTLLGACVAAVVVSVMLSARATADLRDRIQRAGAEQRRLHALREERDALAARQPATADLEQVVQDQAALDAERGLLEKLRAEYQSAELEAMRRPSPPAAPSREPPSRATPDATLQSVIRAVTDGEVGELTDLIDFDPPAREQAEQLFASLSADLRTQYGSPEQLVAHVMTAKTSRALATAEVDQRTFLNPDEASLRVKLLSTDGAPRPATFQLHRDTAGWKLRVPAKVVEGYRALLTGVGMPAARKEPSRGAAVTFSPVVVATPAESAP